MSGIAEVLLNLGYEVSGSDVRESEVTARLRALGAHVTPSHAAAHVENAEVVVASTAIAAENPELVRAHERGIPVIPRAEMLAELMRIKYSVAVAGAHGKTTTTSMVGEILAHGGLDPTVIVGGRLKAIGAHARLGQGPFLVAEADESDGSFLFLSPTIAVITNIDLEHLDYYQSFERIRAAFETFVNRVPFYGTVILPADEPNAAALRPKANRRTVTYALDAEADIEGRDLAVGPTGVRFALRVRGRDEGTIEMKVTGVHNARNALAAVAAGWELGVPVASIRDALREFSGVGRRLELRGSLLGAPWLDDYAHHPTELEATIAALRVTYGRRIIAVFQPHRFSRTRALLDRFATCFLGVSELILLPIYPAGEAPIPGVTSEHLAEVVRKTGGTNVHTVADHAEAAAALPALVTERDLVLTVGAGDVYRVGELARAKEHAV